MHADETKTDAALVRRLIAGQFPGWADLPVVPVESGGTVNALYRLGPDLTVRLPRTEGGSRDVETEHRWLPRLAPHLPFAVPEPAALGVPAEGYPWSWSVCRWLEGENPAPVRGGPLLAADLAALLAALRGVDRTDDAPPAYRSEPPASRDAATRGPGPGARRRRHGPGRGGLAGGRPGPGGRGPRRLGPRRPPARQRPGVGRPADRGPRLRLHGGGRPGGGPDRGVVPAVGRRPVGLPYADGAGRSAFRTRTATDDAAWARGRGWALSIALMELAYYRTSNVRMASTARQVIAEILTDTAPPHLNRRPEAST